MKLSRSLWLFGLALLIAAAPVLPEEDAPTANDKAEDFCKEFKRAYKSRTSAQLTDDIDTIVGFAADPAVDDKGAKKALMGAMGQIAGSADAAVRTYLLKKCATLTDNDDVAKLVLKVIQIELKSRIPEEDVYEAGFETLGKLKSERSDVSKALIGFLKHKENSVVAQACFTMSFYGGTHEKIRKQFFEEVLRQSEGTYSSSQGNDDNAKRRWAIIGSEVMAALNNLSLPPRVEADFPNPAAARAWYNDNKKKPWKAAE